MLRLEAHIQTKLASFKGKRLLVACSGGLDSMVLADVLYRGGWSIELAHVNYQLRGTDSDGDEAFVRGYAAARKIPSHFYRVAPGELSENLQARAREIRYGWFEELVQERTLDYVLLAHHADDQIETFYLNLARNAGIMGLACMPFQRGKMLRPMLDLNKAELLNYAESADLEWREDKSNASFKYARNRLRGEFLPALNHAIPTLRESVRVLIQHFQFTQEAMEERLLPLATQWKKEGNLHQKVWSNLIDHEKVELLRHMGQNATLLKHIDQLSQAENGGRIPLKSAEDFPFDTLLREKDQLHLLISGKSKELAVLRVEKVAALPDSFDKACIYLDAGQIEGELRIRFWQKGDRIASLGLNGSQLIADIISDANIPHDERASIQVVHDDRHIHWCPGLKIGRKALATKISKQIYCCTISQEAIPE